MFQPRTQLVEPRSIWLSPPEADKAYVLSQTTSWDGVLLSANRIQLWITHAVAFVLKPFLMDILEMRIQPVGKKEC